MKKKIGIIILMALVAIQFFPAEKNTGANFGEENIRGAFTPVVPDTVLAVLQAACFDCHSDNTIYPWYTKIQPVGWWMARHIRNGKKKLNFDQWKTYSVEDRNKQLEEIVEVIQEGEMPLKSYTNMHPDAKLTETQKATVINWVRSAKSRHNTSAHPGEEEEH